MLLEGTIDKATYKEQIDPLEQDMLLTKPEIADNQAGSFDAEAVLNYTESHLSDARRLWLNLGVRLQPREGRKHVARGASPRNVRCYQESPGGAKADFKERPLSPLRGLRMQLSGHPGLASGATCFRPSGAAEKSVSILLPDVKRMLH
ncbi:MAG: hypothetical protein QGF00_08695 [Planctomycetota bacterium]|nr:hypothetical protein [Planctomycetota bacterium]MDP7249664.1 hypothetical protein [Planctomycetota bacterium]